MEEGKGLEIGRQHPGRRKGREDGLQPGGGKEFGGDERRRPYSEHGSAAAAAASQRCIAHLALKYIAAWHVVGRFPKEGQATLHTGGVSAGHQQSTAARCSAFRCSR